MKNSKILTYALIITFGILYLCTAFVSFYHAIEFFNLANEKWLSIILSLVAEIGQASVLFSLLAAKDKNKILPWIIMAILTLLQIIGNVFSCYAFIERSNSPEFVYFQKSILFFIEESPETMKVIVAWIVGSILPIIALSMTSLVEKNLQELYETVEDDSLHSVTTETSNTGKEENKLEKHVTEVLNAENTENISNEIANDSITENIIEKEKICESTNDNIDINASDEFKNDVKHILENFDKSIQDASTYKPEKVKDVEVVKLK